MVCVPTPGARRRSVIETDKRQPPVTNPQPGRDMRAFVDAQNLTPLNLVVHQGALGDWVLVFPLLRALEGRTVAATSGEKARLAGRLIPSVEPIDIESRDFTLVHARVGWKQVSAAARAWMEKLDGWV